MKKLIAVPFDRYSSDKTLEGVIYNIIDSNNTVFAQCWVSHKPYTNHDLCLKEMSQAPSNVRSALTQHLDKLFGKDLWQVVTRFSVKTVKQSEALKQHTFHDSGIGFGYDDKYNKLVTNPLHRVRQNL